MDENRYCAMTPLVVSVARSLPCGWVPSTFGLKLLEGEGYGLPNDTRMKSIRFGRVVVVVTVVVLATGGVALYLASTDDARPVASAGSHRAQVARRTVGTRRNVIALSAKEKAEFVRAIRSLQTTPAPHHPSRTWYEQFVQWHRDGAKCDVAHGTSGAIHNSPLFLPWHRELLVKFEAALQKVSGDPSLRVPYWDFNDRASSAAVFTADFMGGMGDPAQGGAVTTGAFAKGVYELRVFDPPQLHLGSTVPYLTRGVTPPPVLPMQATTEALAAPNFDTAPFDATSDQRLSFRQAMEGWRPTFREPDCSDGWQGLGEMLGGPPELHVLIHGSVGGASASQSSPNDPVFWLLHANIDRLWAQWEQTHRERFPATAAGWTPRSKMWPWFDEPVRHFDDTRTLGYRYSA